MSVTSKEYQDAVKKAMRSLDLVFDEEEQLIDIKIHCRAIILQLLHDIGFENIKP